MVYTVTFNPAIDYVVQLGEALQPGALNRSRGEACQWGGKGINVSVVLQRLGVPSTALGFVAGFTGAGLQSGLRAMGLQTDFVALPTGLTRINIKVKAPGQETELNGAGPDIPRAALAALYAKLAAIPAGSMLVLAGSIPACLPQDSYEKILAQLQQRDIAVTVDATRGLLANALKYHPFLIKPNLQELEELAATPLPTEEAIAAAAAQLQRQGARNVLVSMAGAGALLLDETGKLHRIAAPQGRVQNSVGAGDSMVAGFLAGWLQRADYGYALRLGAAAGSATAFRLDLAQREDIEALLAVMP